MVDDSLVARLSTYPAITNIVGSNVFKQDVPQDQGSAADSILNAVVFRRVVDDPFRNIDGKIALNWATYEVRAISSESSTKASVLYDAVRAALQGYSGGEVLFATFAGGGVDDDPIDFLTHRYQAAALFHVSYKA